MTGKTYTIIENRSIISVSGNDRRSFLQGLVSNDMEKAAPDRAIWTAFLTPQGKFLHDFTLAELDGAYLLACEADHSAELLKRLTMHKLRSAVDVLDRSGDFEVLALWGDGAAKALDLPDKAGASKAFAGGAVFIDPRLAEAGALAFLARGTGKEAAQTLGFAPGAFARYDAHRIGLGIPDGSRDMICGRSVLLENGFEELNGVSFDKGCYMGQELTTRTKHRALIRKRLTPVAIDGPVPDVGALVMKEGGKVGQMMSSQGNVGLAMIRLDALEDGKELTCDEAVVTPQKPKWANF